MREEIRKIQSLMEAAEYVTDAPVATSVHLALSLKKPLLIGQGANDPRVKQQESDQIVTAMEAKGIPVTYVLYPDEGHGFARPTNRLSFFAVTDAFLAGCLGGRSEPFGDDFEDSTIEVRAGAANIPGLEAALPAPPPAEAPVEAEAAQAEAAPVS